MLIGYQNYHLLIKIIITPHTKVLKLHPFKLEKNNGEEVDQNLADNREIQKRKFRLRDLVRTADIKKVFSKGDNTNYCYNLYTITEVLHETLLSYRIKFLPERYNQKLLLPTKLTLDENNQVKETLQLIR